MKINKVLATMLSVATISAVSTVSFAQETVSSVKGIISDASGNPVAGASVVIINEETGLQRTTTTGKNGSYAFQNLPIGDNYTVATKAEGLTGSKRQNLELQLGATQTSDFVLTKQAVDEVVVVTGTRSSVTQVALGPSATFDIKTLEEAPAINRNISDVVRIDPRIYVDESRGSINSIQCGGKNPRFNSLTVDGVRLNDSFGLNSNGYPTERMPFSYDAIGAIAVELAPFDVEYGGFTACNINAVTKSGSNEFRGSVFYDYTSDSLRGDSLEGEEIQTGDSDESRFGFNIGGPIIEDKLFFFAAYEKLDGTNLFDRGPIGSGAVNEIDVTSAELEEIRNIAISRYQYDPGFIPQSFDNEDEKFLVKLDWNISDTQRASFNYTYNDGFNIVESDGDNNEFEFSNHLYERGAELKSYVGTLYSDWNDKFSTELRLGFLELDNRQLSVGGTDFGEIRVELDEVDVYLGGDDSRQSNKLKYDTMTFALKGNYLTDNGHNLTFGIEREALDVFNLFVQHTETEIRFDGIDNFRNGFADAIYYNNAPSNQPADAAADWGYELNTIYGQDEFDVNDQLTIVAGLRYDWYTSDDKPAENADFLRDYGFTNAQSLDGEGLIQPRFAFTYDASDSMVVRGGFGLYSGGNPNVWLSNNFSANNVLQFGQRGRSFGYTDGSRSLFDSDVQYLGLEPGVPNGPGWGIPAELYNAVAGGVGDNFEINYLDPNFEIPSEWKIALGTTFITENDYVLSADLLISRGNDTAIVKRADLEQVGTTPEGYPQYDSVREPAFVLTNSSKGNRSTLVSLAVSKEYDNGVDWTLGYAYSDAEDVQPMTSSVAFSNYVNRAFFDPQEEVLSTSNYNIKHRITGNVNWEKAFFGDNLTKVSLFASANSGVPYSRGFNGTIDPYGFTPFLDFGDNVLRPGVARNSEDGSWWVKADLKVTQEFNGFADGHKASAFIVIDNFTNFLNDDWGILEQANFPNTVAEDDDEPESRRGDASRYEIRIGFKYDF
jgi:hypothetical protein